MERRIQFSIAAFMLASIFIITGCARTPEPAPGPSPTPYPMLSSPSAPQPSLPQTVALTRTPTFVPSLTRTFTMAVTPTRVQLMSVQVTEGCHGCAAPQLVMDAQGTLHLFWRWAGGDANVGYAQMKTGGQWESQALRLNDGSWFVFSTNYRLMRNPMGQACLAAFGHNYQTFEPALLVRCHDGTAWLDTQKLGTDDCGPTLGTCDFAFAPDGQLRVLDGKQIPGQEVQAFSLTIDRNGGYHVVLWAGSNVNSVLHRYSADNGKSWSVAEKLADEYSLPHLQPDAQGNLYYWTRTTYRRWALTKGWETPVDMRRYVDFRRYGIDEIKRLVPAPDGRLRVLAGGMAMGSGGIYYIEQLSDEEWSAPILLSRTGVNADLVIDAYGVAHIAYDESSNIHYLTVR